MIQIELQNLISKLHPELKTLLEMAAGEAHRRGHKSVEPEHWYFQLCKESTSWQQCMNEAGVLSHALVSQLDQHLINIPQDKPVTPSLSTRLLSLLQDAWLFASINLNHTQLTDIHILLVLKQGLTVGMNQGLLQNWLDRLSFERLIELAKAVEPAPSVNPSIHRKMSEMGQLDSPLSETPALDKYSQNLTQAALENQLDPICGRSDEIDQVIDILSRRRQNSPILVGEPGVGKTAIVEGLAQQIVAGQVPPSLEGVEVRCLDLTLLQAGASIQGEFEQRLKDVINEIKQVNHPIIVFIDEAHTLIGAGGTSGQNDAANILKPALARGEFRTIAATTWAEYKQYFESDSALSRRFQRITVDEPSENDAIHMLTVMKQKIAAHHQVTILQEAVQAAVRLSIRYLPERKLPDKAMSLLETAAARTRLSQTTTPANIRRLAEKIQYLETDIAAYAHEDFISNTKVVHIDQLLEEKKSLLREMEDLEHQWHRELDKVNLINKYQHQLSQQLSDSKAMLTIDEAQLKQKQKIEQLFDELASIQGEIPLVYAQVTAHSVAEVVALWTGIPIGKMLKEEMARLHQIEAVIGERVIGQTLPIKEIAQALRMSRAGLTDPRKPIGVFLMCGPSGVGKTETALALTDLLYGGEKNLTVINMTEFKEAHKVSMLLGASAGYVGYGKGGVLTEAVRKNPYSVLLLDEMEKAHSSIQDIFYQIFDKGMISDSEGRQIDFRHTIIIMTSNAADAEIVTACDPSPIPINEIMPHITPALHGHFTAAFLGRCTIVPYYPLTRDELSAIALLAINRIQDRLTENYQAKMSVAPEVIEYLVNLNHSPETGARAIEQLIQRQIMPKLADLCLQQLGQGLPIHQVDMMIEKGQVRIDLH